MVNLFDSHCHLDFPQLRDGLEHHLGRAAARGVCGWFVPGCRVEAAAELMGFRKKWGVLFPMAVGIGQHPYFASEVRDPDQLGEQLLDFIGRCRPDAIGECGLDKSRGGDVVHQRRVLEVQLKIAHEAELPIVLHQVGLRDEFLQVLGRVGVPPRGAVVHGFSGDASFGQALVRRGLLLGLGAAITRPERHRLRQAVAELPLEALLLETDAPDQRPKGAPAPSGLPIDLLTVGQTVSELRPENLSEIATTTRRNAWRLFGNLQPVRG